MIIQLNWVRTNIARENSEKTFLHYGSGCPNDQELAEFIADFYGFDHESVTLGKDSYGDILYLLEGRPMAVVWPIFCSYIDNNIVDERFAQLNEQTSMDIRDNASNSYSFLDNQPSIPGSVSAKIESYNDMHQQARDMGYHSILEAFEHLDEIKKGTNIDESLIEDMAKSIWGDVEYRPIGWSTGIMNVGKIFFDRIVK